MARRNIAASPYADRIEIKVGPALESIATLRRSVRPGLHRRRQGRLSRLLRGAAAQARAGRRDPGRQRAVERPAARRLRRLGRRPQALRGVQRPRGGRRPGRGGDADRARRRQPDPAPSSRPSRLRSARSRSGSVKRSADQAELRRRRRRWRRVVDEDGLVRVRGRSARAGCWNSAGSGLADALVARRRRCPRSARGSSKVARACGERLARPVGQGQQPRARLGAARRAAATVPSIAPPSVSGNRSGKAAISSRRCGCSRGQRLDRVAPGAAGVLGVVPRDEADLVEERRRPRPRASACGRGSAGPSRRARRRGRRRRR